VKRRHLIAAVVVAASVVGFTSAAQAAAPRSCRDLPKVAWYQPPSVTVSLLGLASVSVESVQSVKHLYLQAICGLVPNEVWDVVDNGKGKTFHLPPDVSAALDYATPYFPRVDSMYVRGGGPNREIAVILFANGYEGSLFKVDQAVAWTDAETDRVGAIWNLLPYEFMRRAATWLHDIGRYKSCYHVEVELDLLFGLVEVNIPTGTKMCDRALANPLGSMLMPSTNIDRQADVWVHELSHYNNWFLSSPLALAFTDEFASISRENEKVLGVPVPMLFNERYARKCGECMPYGYVSNYAACGEAVVEDFGDSLSVAIGATQGIWKNDHRTTDRVVLDNYKANLCNGYDYNVDRLWNRTGPDAAVMQKKADYIRAHYSFALAPAIEDADGDGIGYRRGDPRGTGDCDDGNPTVGTCAADSCDTATDCDDGNACTVDSCVAGRCVRSTVDADEDGHAPTACGGDDCDDNNRFVHPGAAELCGDGLDNDCQNGADGADAIDATNYWRDADGDGYGTGAPVKACAPPAATGWTIRGGDCRDDSAAFHPGAPESCTSNVDYNCDGSTQYADKDGDGVPACQDCNDNNPSSKPGAAEICDGEDNDCDGLVDEGNPGGGASCTSGLPGDCSAGTTVCTSGHVVCSATVRPGQRAESCDGRDNDCDGFVDNGVKRAFFRDADGDGYGNPAARVDACTAPAGYVANSADCYDANANARPGQTGWFDTHRGDGSFDYDCDGWQRPRYVAVETRSCEFDACHWSQGWKDLIAECGTNGQWLTGCWGGAWICTDTDWATRRQDCR